MLNCGTYNLKLKKKIQNQTPLGYSLDVVLITTKYISKENVVITPHTHETKKNCNFIFKNWPKHFARTKL